MDSRQSDGTADRIPLDVFPWPGVGDAVSLSAICNHAEQMQLAVLPKSDWKDGCNC